MRLWRWVTAEVRLPRWVAVPAVTFVAVDAIRWNWKAAAVALLLGVVWGRKTEQG